MPSAVLVRRARSRSPPGRFDSSRRTRPRLEAAAPAPPPPRAADDPDDTTSALPDDMLQEVFKRLPPPSTIFRCAAVSHRWRRVASRAGAALPPPPRHFGFFRNHGPSPLPPFTPATPAALDLTFLPTPPPCGAILADSRGRRLLLRELGPGSTTELRLTVANPLTRTSSRLPPVPIGQHKVACLTLLPHHGASFRVAVVLFGAAAPTFHVLVYSSAAAWEAATGPLARPLAPHQGPSVVCNDTVYRLDCTDKYIMAVNTSKLTLSSLPLPNAGVLLYTGNCWIGTTEDGRLCFFAVREPLILLKWVLEAPGKWAPQEPVPLKPLMTPAAVGDLHGRKLSAKVADQLHGYKLVSFAGFCEGTGTLFFVMADTVVSLHLETLKMERLWQNDDEWRPLGDVFPFQMVPWPPAIKDSGKAPVTSN